MAKILFIGIDYYSYTTKILEAFKENGHEVTYFPTEDGGSFSKLLKRYLPAQYRKRLSQRHAAIAEHAKEKTYDYVFFLQVHQFSFENMDAICEAAKVSKFILYNWDSISTHDYTPYLKYFDKAITFDSEDAAKHSLDYLPLFGVPDFFGVDHTRAKKYDIYFVGTMVTLSRFDAIQTLVNFCKENDIRLKLHMRCNPAMFIKLILKGKYLEGLTLASLSFDQIIDILEDSHAVFDFPNHDQVGYTMRFVENLCAGKKIISSNRRIRSEGFYTEDRFLIIDDIVADLVKIPSFLDVPLDEGAQFEQFSVGNWSQKILENC